MYAVIETGGKQERVEVGQVVRVERLPAAVGESVVFDRVSMVGGDDEVRLGTPLLDGARVRGTVVEHDRRKKILIYTYKKTQNSNRKQGGHRQGYSAVKIDAIEL